MVDGFGSTEGGVSIAATPGAPPGALGRLPGNVVILHPETGSECPAAEFDMDGRIVNADEATGELVNNEGAGAFSGYYKNPQADSERLRDGRYHSGDLAYRDADGFVYFAGRSSGWLRVDGENLGAAPIERALVRYPGFAQVTVYGVPDRYVGDRVMAAVVPTVDAEFDPIAFTEFLDAQADLGPSSSRHSSGWREASPVPQRSKYSHARSPPSGGIAQIPCGSANADRTNSSC